VALLTDLLALVACSIFVAVSSCPIFCESLIIVRHLIFVPDVITVGLSHNPVKVTLPPERVSLKKKECQKSCFSTRITKPNLYMVWIKLEMNTVGIATNYNRCFDENNHVATYSVDWKVVIKIHSASRIHHSLVLKWNIPSFFLEWCCPRLPGLELRNVLADVKAFLNWRSHRRSRWNCTFGIVLDFVLPPPISISCSLYEKQWRSDRTIKVYSCPDITALCMVKLIHVLEHWRVTPWSWKELCPGSVV